jgi:hypothetical protein
MVGILNGGPKIVSTRTHAVIDYVHAATNFAVAPCFGNATGAGPQKARSL